MNALECGVAGLSPGKRIPADGRKKKQGQVQRFHDKKCKARANILDAQCTRFVPRYQPILAYRRDRLERDKLENGALSGARACTETKRPRHQCSHRTAQRHDRGVPHKYVRGLEIRAMQLQHPRAGQASERACHQSCGYRVYREAAPKQQPASNAAGMAWRRPVRPGWRRRSCRGALVRAGLGDAEGSADFIGSTAHLRRVTLAMQTWRSKIHWRS